MISLIKTFFKSVTVFTSAATNTDYIYMRNATNPTLTATKTNTKMNKWSKQPALALDTQRIIPVCWTPHHQLRSSLSSPNVQM